MKKLVLIGVAVVSLSGCQLFTQLLEQSGSSTTHKTETSASTEKAQAEFKEQDSKFERLKKAGSVIQFNGENFVKSTKAVKGSEPYFVSLALSENRNLRKSISSQTIYLADVAKEPEMTAHFLEDGRKICDLQALMAGSQSYYACNEKRNQRFIALVHKEKNIVSYRSFTSYQQRPSESEEKAIVEALVAYPLDTISR